MLKAMAPRLFTSVAVLLHVLGCSDDAQNGRQRNVLHQAGSAGSLPSVAGASGGVRVSGTSAGRKVEGTVGGAEGQAGRGGADGGSDGPASDGALDTRASTTTSVAGGVVTGGEANTTPIVTAGARNAGGSGGFGGHAGELNPSKASGGSSGTTSNGARTFAGSAGASGSSYVHPPSTDARRILNQVCVGSTESNACYRCEDERCCDTYRACRIDSEACSAFHACFQACVNEGSPEYQCWANCDPQHPDGTLLYSERIACIDLYCAQECDRENECTSCTSGWCRVEYAECASKPDCVRLQYCTANCLTPACLLECENRYPDGKEASDRDVACRLANCSAVCGA